MHQVHLFRSNIMEKTKCSIGIQQKMKQVTILRYKDSSQEMSIHIPLVIWLSQKNNKTKGQSRKQGEGPG